MTPQLSATHLDVAARLRLAVVRTARRLRQESGTGLSPTLTAALATIERYGPLTPSDLADREAIKRPAATRIVARLEADELVKRQPLVSDGRVSLIVIVPAGRELLRRVRERKDEYLARRMRDLPPEDLAALDRAADVLERSSARQARPHLVERDKPVSKAVARRAQVEPPDAQPLLAREPPARRPGRRRDARSSAQRLGVVGAKPSTCWVSKPARSSAS